MEILGGSPAGVIDESAVRTAGGDEEPQREAEKQSGRDTVFDVVLDAGAASGSDTLMAWRRRRLVAGVPIQHGFSGW